MAVAYIDARDVMDRLDEAVESCNWSDEYTVLPSGLVMCKLSIQIDKQWVSKTDVGSPSEQPDSGDRIKACFSDALKRAAVKWGVGRYLYNLKAQWVAFDPKKKQLLGTPQLPASALPKRRQHAGREDRRAEPDLLGKELGTELFELCEPSGTDPAKLLLHYGVLDFHLLPASAYNHIKTVLTGRIQENQAALKENPHER